MLAASSQILDFVLNIAVIIIAARWAAQRTGRVRAILFASAAACVYSVISDFSIHYAVPDFDRSLKAVMINAVVTAALGYGVSFFVTLRPASRRVPLGGI